MPNSEGKKRLLGRIETMQKRKRKQEYTSMNAAGVESMKDGEITQQEKYEMLLQNIPCAVYSAYPGKAGPTNFMSNKWKDWTGYSPEELYEDAEAWPKCIHPDDREEAVNAYSGACQDNVPYNLEYRIVHKETGHIRYVRDQGLLRKNKKGDIIRVDGIITDISGLKRAEKSLRESEEQFKNLFNNALLGLYRTTPDGRILMANPALVRMLGYDSFEELAKRNLEEEGFEPQYFRSNFKERIEAKGMVIGLEANWTRRDGTTLSVRESAKAIRDEHGNILYYEGTVEDITERKQAEEALHKSQERFRTVIETAQDSIFIKDHMLRYTHVNPAMEKLFGIPAPNLIGCTDDDLFGTEAGKHVREIDSRVLGGQIVEEEHTKPIGGVPLTFHVVKVPMRDATDKVVGLCGIARDITERKRMEEELRKHRDHLEELVRKRTDELTNAYETLKVENQERKRTEQALHEVEREKTTVLENLSDLIVYRDKNMVTRWASKSMANWHRMSQDQIVGRICYKARYGRDEPCEKCHIIEAMKSGKRKELEKQFSDGRCWHVIVNPVLDDSGQVIGTIEVSQDITERMQSEEALKASEGKLNAMLQSISDHMSMMDKDLNILWVNDVAKRRFGDDIVGKKCYEVYHGRQSPCEPHSCLTVRAFQDGGIHEHDSEDTDKDGNTVWFHCVANVALRDNEGKATAVLEVSTDITERIRANQALQESEERFRAIYENALVGLYRTTPDGRILMANPALVQMLGYSSFGELAQLNLEEEGFSRDCQRSVFKQRIEAEDRIVGLESRWMRRDGTTLFVRESARIVRDENGEIQYYEGTVVDFTEHKKAEEALRKAHEELEKSESRFRELVENMREVFWMENADGTELLYVSPAYEEIWGRSCEEFYRNPRIWIDTIHPDDKKRVNDAFAKGRLDGTYSEEFRIIRPDGSMRWIWDRGVPIRNESDEVIRVAGVAEDVTERRQTEEALRESEEKFRSLADRSPNMIFIYKKGKVVYANKKCEEVIGYKREELCSPGFYFRTLIAPESMAVIRENLARHLRSEEVKPYDYCLINKKGERIEAINATKLIQYEGESAILGVVTDITERKKAEQALRESEERLKILFESAPDAIYLIDSEVRIVDGNRAAEELIGFAKDEVIGKSLAEVGLLSAGQLSKAEANVKKVATGKLSGPNEYTLKRKDGSHVSIEVRTFPVKIEGKMLSLGIARDITEHKRTEKKLLEHQAKLKSLASQLSLTEERERYRLATDLHDRISQSLVISKIKLDQLRKSSSSDEFNRPLEDVCNCLGQIIDDTRTLTFDLSYPILYELGFEAAVAEWLTDQIQEKHGIKTEFEDDGQKKPLDDDIRVLLFRNVRELLINVVKHAQANKVKVSIRKVKDHVRVSVEDDGIGFDPAEVTSMTAKRAEFGLFSIRERLEQLGGLIEIDSKTGHGSKITMMAPLKCKNSTDRTQK